MCEYCLGLLHQTLYGIYYLWLCIELARVQIASALINKTQTIMIC